VVDELRERAAMTLADLGVDNVRVLPAGDELGAPEYAPYDVILVTAAAPRVPPDLVEQLRMGGRLVAPVGSIDAQELLVVTRTPVGLETRSYGACRFVPLVGPEGFVPRRPPAAPLVLSELTVLRARVAGDAPDERAEALRELAAAHVHLEREALEAVRQAIDAEHDPGRRMALTHDYLLVAEPADAPGALAELLRHGDPFVRDAALDVAAEIGAGVLPALRELAGDPDRETRWFAVEALARLANEAVVPTLIEALRDDDFAIRWAAAHGLVRVGEAAFAPLLHALAQAPASLAFHRAARRVLRRVAPPGVDREHRLSALLDALARGTTIYESGTLALALLQQLRRERLGFPSEGEDIPGAACFESALERASPRLGAGRIEHAYRASLQPAAAAAEALVARDPVLAERWDEGDPRRAIALLEAWAATVALALLIRDTDQAATCDTVARGVAWLFDADGEAAAAELDACLRQRAADLDLAEEPGAVHEPVAWTLLYLRSLRAVGADVPPLSALSLPVASVTELARSGALPAALLPSPEARRRVGELLAYAVADAEQSFRARGH
jgi:hypothetical protein